ncbi:uncharacterized protein VP01_14120g1 [Puccinia sorghi]|uniref:Uncharacterized protein n=1 Tax=Puccinia sorghi TaxID=27349 RepID=A0A0L6VKT5_9BASI|nr:uncharacterized protein VP01_14120g1 [Puccinia sorghi]
MALDTKCHESSPGVQRTKQTILNLPKKIEKDLHNEFIHLFGRLWTAGKPWNPAEFFKQLTMIRQYCNHPMFAREVISALETV